MPAAAPTASRRSSRSVKAGAAPRSEGREPLRQGVRRHFGGFAQGIARGLAVRHDHGSQYMAHDFQKELRFLGTGSSPAFVRAPEGNGCAERFIRALKENLLWVRGFATVEELRQALLAFREAYNAAWLIERHGFRPPAAIREEQLSAVALAAEAPSRCPTNRGRYTGDPVHGQTAGAAGEQATKQVVVLLVVPERQPGIVGQLRLRAIPAFLADDGRDRDRDPLLARPQPAAALARVARLARARLPGFDEVVPVRVSGPDVDRIRQDVVDHRGRPGMPARARVRGPEVQPLEDLADGHPSIDQPAVERPDKIRFGRVDLEPSAGTIAAGDVAVAVGCAAADEAAGLRLLQLAAAEALAKERALVLGDSALDLQEELVAGVVGDVVVEKRHLAAGAAKLFQDQHLIGVSTGQPIRAEHRDDVDLGIADGVAQRVEPGPVEPCAAVTLVLEDMRDLELMPGLSRPGAQGRELAVDRLLALLALGGDPCIGGGAHGSSPPVSGSVVRRR